MPLLGTIPRTIKCIPTTINRLSFKTQSSPTTGPMMLTITITITIQLARTVDVRHKGTTNPLAASIMEAITHTTPLTLPMAGATPTRFPTVDATTTADNTGYHSTDPG